MSNDIKAGDLVMVVGPNPCGCCLDVGFIYKAKTITKAHQFFSYRCRGCGYMWEPTTDCVNGEDFISYGTHRLIKIDPPAEGDSLPTRADKPIKELA